jgi:clan AA aspartic protease (TIGR02281 family)
MLRRTPLALLPLILAAGCQEIAGTAPTPEYRPEEAGTVDHALCLLGFDAVLLREVATGHHLVEATINGRTGSFVLDTGANVTVIDRRHLEHFGLSGTGGLAGMVGGLGGGQQATQVAIDSLQIGDVKVRQQRIVAADLGQLLQMLGQVSRTTVYGLIGQDVMKEHRGIVDVAKPMLHVIAEDRDPAPVEAGKCQGQSDVQPAAEAG